MYQYKAWYEAPRSRLMSLKNGPPAEPPYEVGSGSTMEMITSVPETPMVNLSEWHVGYQQEKRHTVHFVINETL